MIGSLLPVPLRGPAGRRAAVLALAVLAVLSGLVVAGQQTVPRPLGVHSPVQVFSADRALTQLRALGSEPRPMGSPAAARARDLLLQRLRGLDLGAEVRTGLGGRATTGLATVGHAQNVVATLPGTRSTGTVLIVGHYDSSSIGPGAGDNGAAVASMLECARALGQGPAPRNDVTFLFTDGEEEGEIGADAYVRSGALPRGPAVVLNWEGRGTSGPSALFETGAHDSRWVSLLAGAVPRPRGDSSLAAIYRLMPASTDFSAFTDAGLTGLNFAFVGDTAWYHSAGDSIEHLDPGTVQHQGETMLALARAIGSTDLTRPPAAHDDTYFPVLGVLVRYPDTLVVPLAVLAVLAVVGLAVLARRRRLLSVPRLLGATAATGGLLAGCPVLVESLWFLLAALRPEYDVMGGLVHRPVTYALAVVCVTAAATSAWYLLLRRRLGPAALAMGGLVWTAGLGMLCALLVPGLAFVFTVPALGGALGGLVAVQASGRLGAVAAVAAGLVPAVLVLPPLAVNVFLAGGLSLIGAVALPLTLLALTLLPLLDPLLPGPEHADRRRVTLGVPATAALTAALLVAVGLAVNRPGADQPRPTHLAYVLDADTGRASWVSAETDPTAWTRQYVGRRDTSGLPAGFARGELWTGPAVRVPLHAPRLDVRSRRRAAVTFHVVAPPDVRRLTLRLDRPISSVTVSVAGAAPVRLPVDGVRRRTWPGEIRLCGLPASGADVTVGLRDPGPVRVTVMGETPGLAAVPGFVPRPADLTPSRREDGELVSVTRTYRT